MSAFCVTSCVTAIQTPIPQKPCFFQAEKDCLGRLLFFRCDAPLPPVGSESVIATWLDTIIADGQAFITGDLRNVEFADPTTSGLNYSDCKPDLDLITSRELTFEDLNKYTATADGTAYPWLTEALYKSFKQQGVFNIGFVYCSGKIILAVDGQTADNTSTNLNTITNQGTYVSASILSYKGSEKVEKDCYVKHTTKIKFLGDPLTGNIPLLNISDLTIGAYPNIDLIR